MRTTEITKVENRIAGWNSRFGSKIKDMRERAWLIHKNKVYWAWAEPKARQAYSCVTVLIQEIFYRYKDLSFFILRERIFTTRSVSEMDKGMVLLAAKRISERVAESEFPSHLESVCLNDGESGIWLENFERKGLSTTFPFLRVSEAEAFEYLQALIAQIPRGEILHDYNRAIAALVVNAAGEPLVAATNYNFLNKTLHAEVRCLQYLSAKQISLAKGSRLFVSLKPCRMCAGMLAELTSAENVEVVYLENDPGRLAQGSSFEKLGRFRKFQVTVD